MPSTTFQPNSAAGIDTWIRNGASADTNFGDNQAGDNVISFGTSTGGAFDRGLIRFDISSITVDVIASATLTFKGTNYLQSGLHTLYARRCTKTFIETEATWNKYETATAWATAGGDYETGDESSVSTLNTATTISFTVTALVQDALDNRSSILNLMLFGPEGATENRFEALSSNDGTASNRPALAVSWDLSPTAGWTARRRENGWTGRAPL